MNTNNLDETTVMFANMDKKLKIIVDTAVGFNDYDTLQTEIDAYIKDKNTDDVILVCRKQPDGNSLCERYSNERKINIAEFVTPLDQTDIQNVFEQNRHMINYANHVITFGSGDSPITKHLINLACDKKLNVRII